MLSLIKEIHFASEKKNIQFSYIRLLCSRLPSTWIVLNGHHRHTLNGKWCGPPRTVLCWAGFGLGWDRDKWCKPKYVCRVYVEDVGDVEDVGGTRVAGWSTGMCIFVILELVSLFFHLPACSTAISMMVIPTSTGEGKYMFSDNIVE